MKKETLALLGLNEGATEQQVHEAVQLLKGQADKAKTIELAAITAAVDKAVSENVSQRQSATISWSWARR